MSSCSYKNHEERYFVKSAEISADNCLQYLSESEQNPLTKFYELTKEGVGHGTSYLLTGMGYASDIAIYVVAGIGAGITICSPIILAEAAASNSGTVSGECIAKVGEEAVRHLPESLGQKAYKTTKSLRCPEVDHISQTLRRVASCYKKKNKIKKFQQQVKAIREDDLISFCSSNKEKKKVQNLLSR